MDGYVVHGGMGMARGSSVRIEDGAGILVYVREGELWITQQGDQRDHFVTAGRSFRVETGDDLFHDFERRGREGGEALHDLIARFRAQQTEDLRRFVRG